MDLREVYHYLFVELTVPQTREWLLVSSPYPLLLIILGYIYFILYAGPRYMKDRPPYELRTFILIYDIIQILANLWFIREHLSAGWLTNLPYVIYGMCQKISFNTNKILNVTWWLIFLKLFDFVETCVFVLKKKQNQVSGLHVYHHVSNMIFLWYYLKYVLDERATFISLCNCSVHVIMYIYYFIAAWSPNFQQMIYPIKPFITKLQMVQFVVFIILILEGLIFDCDVPVGIGYIFIGNLVIFLYLFYDFYKKSYIELSKQKNN